MSPGALLVATVGAAVFVTGSASFRGVVPPRVPSPSEAATASRRSSARWARRVSRGLPLRAVDEDLAVAEWCAQLAREVRAGSALATALRSVETPSVVSDRLASARMAVERGTPVGTAMRVAPCGSAALDLATSVIVAVATFGGATAESLDHAASVLRRRSADRAESHVHAAQSRMSATVMSALPPAFLGLLLVTTPDTRGSVMSGLGIASVLAGAALNLAGWRWIRRIVRSCR